MADLFSPIRIGGVEVRNRLMQAAHSKLYSHDGHESDQDVAYAERRARGGIGLMVAGNRFVHPSTAIRGFQDGWREDGIASGRRLTDAVHAHGARVFVQLNHHGAQAQPQGPLGPRAVYSSSRIISPSTGVTTTACTEQDIAVFVEGWARSAWVARESGFDGVEVHMAHGYLLQQFLSPRYNHRTDGYGGDVRGRTRFPREVLRAVRDRVGNDYVVGIRMVADEFLPGGLTNADVLEIIDLLRAETRIDFIDLGAGGYDNPHYVFPSAAMPAAWMRDEVATVKARNPDIAVFGVGTAPSVEAAGEVVRSGIADMVALTRAQIADPDLAEKLRTGRTDEIIHCIRLNQGCLGRGALGLPVSCTVNPVVGRERERSTPAPTSRRRRFVVVGGGPAGMKAAGTLAANGHEAILLERAPELGGQLRLAATVPGRHTLRQLIGDLTDELDRHGVEVRLATEATPERLASLGADGLVLATGSRPPASGSALADATPLVETGDGPPVLDAWTALRDPDAVGHRVAVVDDDGTNYAAGVVLALADRGHEVHVCSWFDVPFPHVMATMDRHLLLDTLRGHGVIFLRNARPRRTGGGLIVTDATTGEERGLGELDSVVAATPREAVHLDVSGRVGVEVVAIGDAVSPRSIDTAIFDAFEMAFAAGHYHPPNHGAR